MQGAQVRDRVHHLIEGPLEIDNAGINTPGFWVGRWKQMDGFPLEWCARGGVLGQQIDECARARPRKPDDGYRAFNLLRCDLGSLLAQFNESEPGGKAAHPSVVHQRLALGREI